MAFFNNKRVGAGLVLAAQLAAGQALAQNNIEGMVGVGAYWSPEFLGSSESNTDGVVLFEFNIGERFFVNQDGIGGYLVNSDSLRVSASIDYGGGRDEADSRFLTGLGDIDNGAIFNLGVEYEAGPVTPYLELTKFSRGSKGLNATVGVETEVPLGSVFGRSGAVLTAGLSADWGNDKFNSAYYGVTAAQSASSGLSQYNASSGFHAASLDIGFRVPVTESWSVGGIATYSRLMGDAKNSPFVQQTDGTSVGLFGVYEF